jgi:lipoprotein-anchoring transpeptidase ErfK/SrfK
MVTEGQPGDSWVRVQLPVRPNGQEGWIDTSDYSLSDTRVRAEVTLSETSVRVFDGEDLIAESGAVIGAEDTPTPIGTFYVAAKKRNTPEEYYLGSWALVLSSFSEVLPSFSGGLPVIAVHGTPEPDRAGEAITFGCVRVPNDVIEFLAEHVPLGAPVHISA